MKSWSQWIRNRRSKRIAKTSPRRLQSEFLEPRQLLAGDVLQTAMGPVASCETPSLAAREPQAALSLDAEADLQFEFDSNERQVASIANDAQNAVVAAADDGSYIIVRQQETSARNGWDIFGQRYDADGVRVGPMFRVNALTQGDQTNPQVAVSQDGSFTVVFQSQSEKGGNWEVMARSYDTAGVATRTREFAINSEVAGDQVNPAVSYINIATFVVAWNGRGAGAGADADGIFAQRVTFNDPLGDPIRVNFHTQGAQTRPAVASTGDGDFIVGWDGQGDGDASGIYMRKFFVDGQNVTRTREIRVNSLVDGADEYVDIVVSPIDGTVLFVWQNQSDDSNVRGQLFDVDLNRVGGTLEINQTSTGDQGMPSATFLSQAEVLDDGGAVVSPSVNDFVMVWHGNGAEDSSGIYARRMSSSGTFVGDEVLVNKRQMAGPQMNPDIANVGSGVEIVWTGGTSTGRNGIFRREFKDAALNTAPVIDDLTDELILTDQPFTFTVNVTDPDNDPIVRVRTNNGATVVQDETDPTMYTITPAAGFQGRINVTITAQDLVNEIVRNRFTLSVADQLPPTLTMTTGLLDSETNVREIATGDTEIRIPLTIVDSDTDLVDMRVTRIVTGGDARVVVASDNSELIVTARTTDSSEFTAIVFDGTHRVKQDVRVRFDGDAPTVDLNGVEVGVDATTDVLIGAGSQSLGLSGLNITDLNNNMISSAAVSIVGGGAGDVLSVNESVAPNITVSSTNGNLLLVGIDTIENYEALLRTVRYEQTASDGAESVTVDFSVNDGINDSGTATATLQFQRIDHIAFARALSTAGATFYGAHWSEETTMQKELFQDGQILLPYVEVSNPNRTTNQVGTDNNITTFPTWIFADESRLEGEQSAETLASRAGIEIPATSALQNSAPFVHDVQIDTTEDDDGDGVGDDVLLIGSPLYVPLDGYDPDGDEITYTVTSSNPDVVPTVQSGNRSMRLNVAGFGDMVFEFFEAEAPLATAQIIQLVEEGFYEDIIFHRVLNDFVIQAGDPNGTGSGGSELDDFEDQFHLDVQHNRTGLLSMAKTNDDTNNSQFFVTEGPSRHLDFNHTIFGVQTEGDANRESISNTDTVDGRPLTSIVIENAEVFTDRENAVVQLKANEGATGTSTITVTATDSSGGSYVTSFEVNIEEDTINGGPFLAEFNDEIETPVNTPVTFDLDAIDIEGDAVFFDINAFGLGDNATAEVDNETGEITVTPTDDFLGPLVFVVGVRPGDDVDSDTQDLFDAQDVTVFIGDREQLFDLVEVGDFTDEGLLGVRTDLIEGAPEVTLNEHVSGAIDYSDFSNPPTYGPHHGPLNQDGGSVVPRPTGVYDTVQPDEDLVHNIEHGHVWISYNPTLISTGDLLLLERMVENGGTNAGVILTPRPKNTSAIAVASWAHLLELSSFDDQMIRDFINTNRGHAPEGYIPSGEKTDESETLDDGHDHTP